MLVLKYIEHVMLIHLVSNCMGSLKYNTSTFKISFQESEKLSKEDWAEYKSKNVNMKEFSVCFWHKLRYFSESINTFWGYCFKMNQTLKMDCIQFDATLVFAKANRHINLLPDVGRGI